MAENNIKGWIAFLVIFIIIVGGSFSLNHIIKSPPSAVVIDSIGSNLTSSSDYNSTSSILNLSLSSPSTVNITVGFSTVTAGSTVNYTIVSPSIGNTTAYDAFYNSTYPGLFSLYSNNFNTSYNKSGAPPSGLAAAYKSNVSNIQANASANASAEAYSNTTFNFVSYFTGSVTMKSSAKSGKLSFNLVINKTAFQLLSAGQSVYVKVALYFGAQGYNGYVELFKS
jgi:hypothetical protein